MSTDVQHRPQRPLLLGQSRRGRVLNGVLLFLLIVTVVGTLISSREQQDAYQTHLAQAHATRLAQEKAALDKFCRTFGKLAALQPPAGSPVDNPSRAYEQNQHILFLQALPEIGCPASK
jgi:hypothetical protein